MFSYDHNQKLLNLLQLIVDDQQRLRFFEDVATKLLDAGHRQQAGVLASNLAESMDRTSSRRGNGGSADITDGGVNIQRAFLQHSIRILPEDPIATRSLGYRLEQSGEELKAMEIYRESLTRSTRDSGINNDHQRLDLRLLLASACSPFLQDAAEADERHSNNRRL